MPPERDNGVVDAASHARQRFVLPMSPQSSICFTAARQAPYSCFALFPVLGRCAYGEQRSHQNRLAAGLLATEF